LVAVAALTDDRHTGELYELTGPRLLTFADAVAEIGPAAGRDVTYGPLGAATCRTARSAPSGSRRAVDPQEVQRLAQRVWRWPGPGRVHA